MQQDRIHKPSDQILIASASAPPLQEQRMKLLPQYGGDQVMKCPRCDSLNTKFCYYNNYSLTQPRHFCKNCKRYWTKGGALRNVPVGGGCRKNKRIKQRASTDNDQLNAASFVSTDGEGKSVLISSALCDGLTSSSLPLQQSISATGDRRIGLTLESLDQATRAFSVSSAPTSENFVADQESFGRIPLEYLQIPFDLSIQALTLAGNLKKDVAFKRQQNAENLRSMFEPQISLLAPASSSSLNDTLAPYNFCLENFGIPVSNGDLQWRLPPRLVTMAEEGKVTNGRPFMQMMEQADLMGITHEKQSGKGKLSLDSMHLPISTEIDEVANQSCCDWHIHPPTDNSVFDATGDTLGYLTSGGSWTPDMSIYGMAGKQLL